jgi:amino acid transporter
MRVYDRMQRQQVKWLLFGLAIVLTLNTLYRGLENLVPGFSSPDSLYQLADGTVTALLFVAIPLAIGVAILRHRLWDIDLIINRTLVYGSLTLSLALVYLGLVVVLQSLVRVLTGAVGQQPLVIVASTLVITYWPWCRRPCSLPMPRYGCASPLGCKI